MLRAFVLMFLLQYESIPKFAQDLRKQPRLAEIAGFKRYETPGVGTYYLFMDRLEDGPYQPSCSHQHKASETRKGKHRRNLKEEKALKEQKKKEIEGKCDSITENLKKQLLENKDQKRPLDFQQRLEDILIKCAVIPSLKRGLLGDPKKLIIAGDGSSLVSGASALGKPTCPCRNEGIYK